MKTVRYQNRYEPIAAGLRLRFIEAGYKATEIHYNPDSDTYDFDLYVKETV